MTGFGNFNDSTSKRVDRALLLQRPSADIVGFIMLRHQSGKALSNATILRLSVCQCWPTVGVPRTIEITVDDLYSKIYLQNYR